jgi:hypothetical protein
MPPEQQVSKEKGLMFYQQYKRSSAIPKLRIAGRAGDREAQYFIEIARRIKNVLVSA